VKEMMEGSVGTGCQRPDSSTRTGSQYWDNATASTRTVSNGQFIDHVEDKEISDEDDQDEEMFCENIARQIRKSTSSQDS
jgi:hypothetical protein